MTDRALPGIRPEGWETRFSDEVAAGMRRAHEPGKHDCAKFADRCIVAIFGHSPWTYQVAVMAKGDASITANSGGAALKKANRRAIVQAGGFEAALDAWADRIDWRFAWRGDLALVDVEGEPSVAVVDVVGLRIAARPGGLATLPITAGNIFWKVGH